jgi:CDP-paratose synthetase
MQIPKQKRPTLLLTGATGFLGSHLLKRLISLEYSVVVLKRQKSNLRRIECQLAKTKAVYNLDDGGVAKAFATHDINTIIHCATDYGRKNSDPLQIVDANLILPLTLLYEGRKNGVKTFINTDTLLDKRINDYSLSKRQFVDWLQSASGEITAINVALEHFYGPDDDTSKFVSWLIDALLRGEKSIPLTAGEQKRDFIYIEDVVDAFIKILEYATTLKVGLHRFEVGSGQTTAIRTLVEMIADECQPHRTQLGFGQLPYRPNEVMDSKVALDPLLDLGWQPMTQLRDGLKQTVQAEKHLRGLTQ